MTVIHSLRTKILVIVLIFPALFGAAFVLYSIATTRNYKNLRLEVIRKIVEFETEKVNNVITGLEHGAIVLALDGLIFHQTNSYNISETLVMGYLRGFPAAIGGGFWFEPYVHNDQYRICIYAFYDKTTGDVRPDNTFIVDEYDYHNKNWYREIISTVTDPYQVTWTKPYVDDSGSFSLMTTAGAGIFDHDNKLIGISTIDWKIEAVINELTAIKPTKNSFVMLCVPDQDYVISSTRTRSIIGESIKNLPYDINSDSFIFEGVKYLRFDRYMNNGWLLSVQIPENEIYAEMEKHNNRFSFIIALSSSAMLFLAYYAISKLVNRPIKQLTLDVSSIALGSLDTRIKINSNDEVGLLAKTFNKMTSDLKKSIDENTREHAEKERISAELNIAASIQASMLPSVFPPFPERKEFDLYASMFPEREVGGDFYDFYFIDKDNLALVIADVSGKSVPAALFMVIARTLIKNSSSDGSPKNIFESVNNKLCENNKSDMFVTAFMGIYNIPSGKFKFVNAGHNPPLIRKHSGNYEFLKIDPCYVLAWKKNTTYKESEITLEPDDILYLYTDGVTEAMDSKKKLFGEERLLAALNKNINCAPKELLSSIKIEVDNFADGIEQADDITMLALKVNRPAEKSVEKPENTFKKIEIKMCVENLNTAINFINTELERHGCPRNLQGEIDIATEEIFINIADYAYAPDTGNAVISISITDKITIRFEDSGRPFNPLDQDSPNFEKHPAEREPGGLGIFLVKKIMDNVEYSRIENKNILVMTKAINFPV